MLLTRMPDLSVIYVQQCDSLDKIRTTHYGSGNYTQTVSSAGDRDECTCPGYKFHGKCKHVAQAREELCDWSAQWSDETQTLQQQNDMICPKCGGDTRIVGV